MISASTREFAVRSWRVVAAGLLGSIGLLYALSAVGRHVGDDALGASGLVTTILNMVAVLGAGHGIRLLHTYFAAGPATDERMAAVRARSTTVRDASMLVGLAWLVVGIVVVGFSHEHYFVAAAWIAGLPSFMLAPRMGLISAMMQLANAESRLLRYAAAAVAAEVVSIFLLSRIGLDRRILFPLIILSGQMATAGLLVLNRSYLVRNRPDLWEASRVPWTQRPFGPEWRSEIWQASFTAWDALAIMGYYTVAVSIAAASSAQVAAVVGLVTTTNRAVIVPLKSAGLVGGRLIKQSASADERASARSQTRLVAAVMVVAAASVAVAGQFSDVLFGLPRSAAAVALAIAALQLVMEPWVGFASGQGKVLHGADFGVRSIVASIVLVAAPLMLVLAGLRPDRASSYLIPFVVARLCAMLAMRREIPRHDAQRVRA